RAARGDRVRAVPHRLPPLVRSRHPRSRTGAPLSAVYVQEAGAALGAPADPQRDRRRRGREPRPHGLRRAAAPFVHGHVPSRPALFPVDRGDLGHALDRRRHGGRAGALVPVLLSAALLLSRRAPWRAWSTGCSCWSPARSPTTA